MWVNHEHKGRRRLELVVRRRAIAVDLPSRKRFWALRVLYVFLGAGGVSVCLGEILERIGSVNRLTPPLTSARMIRRLGWSRTSPRR